MPPRAPAQPHPKPPRPPRLLFNLRLLSAFSALCSLCSLWLVILPGCAEGPRPSFEAFARNKLGVLARNIESTRDAQKAATDQLAKSVEQIKLETGEGAAPAQSYELARRMLATSETRVRMAHSRVHVVKNDGAD